MSGLAQDLRFAVRSLKKSWLVTLLAVASLALAIGGNGTVFSLINGVLFRPMPYEAPERIALVNHGPPPPPENFSPLSPANFVDLRERATSFEAFGAIRFGAVNLVGVDDPERLSVAYLTPEMFDVLGVEPTAGRTFTAEEARPGSDRVALLSHETWSRRFAADPNVLGSTLRLDDGSYSVVGVLPEEFELFDPELQLYLPLTLDPADLPREARSLIALGLLRPDTTPETAEAEVAALSQRLVSEHPDVNRDLNVTAKLLREVIPGEGDRQLLTLLQGALLFVLLIACANLANLLLARGRNRRREVALRGALGAGRGRIVRQLLTESLLLASAGGVLGLGLSVLGTRALAAAFAGQMPKSFLPAMDMRVVLFTVAVTALAGLLFGLAPAFQTSRSNLSGVLREASGGSGGRRLLIRGLVVAEVALGLVLLCGAGVLLQSFLALQNADTGFDPKGLLTAQISLSPSTYEGGAQATAFYEELVETTRALPGVTSATVADRMPRNFGVAQTELRIPGRDAPSEADLPRVRTTTIMPGYLDTLGIRRLSGRDFDSRDRADAEPVVLVSRALAKEHFPDEDPVGRMIEILDEPRRIVGMVGDVQSSVFQSEGPEATVYFPFAQRPDPNSVLLLRATDPSSVAPLLRRAMREIDPDQPLGAVQTLQAFLDRRFTGVRVFNVLLGGFGALALLLSAIGIYGVLAYSVTQRTREIGIRMALGARRGQVVANVVRQGMILAGLGFLIGLPGVYFVVQAVTAALTGIGTAAPESVAVVAVVLLVVAAVASLAPARRAAGLDPALALKRD